MAGTQVHFHFRQASLPKLSTAKDINRRDSLSSSRTGDSGYISDPEFSLSPLEIGTPDRLYLHSAILPLQKGIPAITFDSPALSEVEEVPESTPAPSLGGPPSSYLLQIHKGAQKRIPGHRIDITSNPSPPTPNNNEKEGDCVNNISCSKSLSIPATVGNCFSNAEPLSRNDEIEQWIKDNLPSRNRPRERVSSITSISSAGSADMYSATDISEDEQEEELNSSLPTLPKATFKIIELIMRKIEVNLAYAAYIQCANGNTPRRNSSANLAPPGGRGAPHGSGGKRKSRSDDSFPPDGHDDDDPNKRRRVSVTTTEDSESSLRFACPFFKHDPNRYRNRRTCPGPGWPTVHRMKEHLYRAHAQPIFCPRCYTMFDSDGEFSAHLRSSPCEISPPQPIEGIDRETLKSLRKRSPALRLEEDKWRDTYQLLFPDVSAAEIPSPYYDSDSPSEVSRRFRRELLERIRAELFTTAEQTPGSVQQNLLRQVAAIIQRCETQLLEEFHSTSNQPGLPPAVPGNPGSAPTSVPAFPSTQNMPAPPMPFTPPGWDEIDLIDWNAVFPPVPDMQAPDRGNHEPLPTFTTPVWT